MVLPTGVYRADHVGSFLRPKSILDERTRIAEKKAPVSSLRPLEDREIASVAASQLKNGLRSITDGEFRRAYFHLDFLQHLAGVEVKGSIGAVRPFQFSPPSLVVSGRLGHPNPIQVDDFKYLETVIQAEGAEGKATTKVCIPSPTMVHFRG